MTDQERKAMQMAIPLLVAYQDYTGDSRIANKCGDAIADLDKALAQPEQTVEPPDYVEPVTFDYHDGWEEGFKAGVEAKTKGTKMTLEEFRDYVVLNAMYETIYTDGEGKSILIISMLDTYALVNKIKEQA